MTTPSQRLLPTRRRRSTASDPDLLAYEIVAFRRMQYDALMWQVPALSLTAQAFLLTISLGSESSRTARVGTALLAALTAVISVQLLAKHRRHENIDSVWLERYELEHEMLSVHCRPERRAEALNMPKASWLVSRPSYRMWRAGLGTFGLVAVLAAALALVAPGTLRG